MASPDYRHVSTGTLAVLAQRLGRVCLPVILVPPRATVWVAASQTPGPSGKAEVRPTFAPSNRCGSSITVIRLRDGTRAYVQR